MWRANLGCSSTWPIYLRAGLGFRQLTLVETCSPLDHRPPREPLPYVALERNLTLSRVSICCMAVRAGREIPESRRQRVRRTAKPLPHLAV